MIEGVKVLKLVVVSLDTKAAKTLVKILIRDGQRLTEGSSSSHPRSNRSISQRRSRNASRNRIRYCRAVKWLRTSDADGCGERS